MSPSRPFFPLIICQFKLPSFLEPTKTSLRLQTNPNLTRQLSYRPYLKWRTVQASGAACNMNLRMALIFQQQRRNFSGIRSSNSNGDPISFLWNRCNKSETLERTWDRDLVCFAVFRRNCSSGKDKDNGDEKNGNKRLWEEIEVYDPSQDHFFTQDIAYGSKENKGSGEAERPVFIPEAEEPEDLSPPTNCCQSGCPTCVWLEYAEKLSKKYSDPKLSREKVLQDLEGLDDENIKAFIMMELRVKKIL